MSLTGKNVLVWTNDRLIVYYSRHVVISLFQAGATAVKYFCRTTASFSTKIRLYTENTLISLCSSEYFNDMSTTGKL